MACITRYLNVCCFLFYQTVVSELAQMDLALWFLCVPIHQTCKVDRWAV